MNFDLKPRDARALIVLFVLVFLLWAGTKVHADAPACERTLVINGTTYCAMEER